jgi:hypothetical protein
MNFATRWMPSANGIGIYRQPAWKTAGNTLDLSSAISDSRLPLPGWVAGLDPKRLRHFFGMINRECENSEGLHIIALVELDVQKMRLRVLFTREAIRERIRELSPQLASRNEATLRAQSTATARRKKREP